MFFSLNSFAAESICSYEETSDFFQALRESGVKPLRVSKDRKKFSSVEKQLIYKMVTQQEWSRNLTLGESLDEFAEGEVRYYNIDGVQYHLVHYWPGDNEYGAWYKVNKNGSIKLVAVISDSFIECR